MTVYIRSYYLYFSKISSSQYKIHRLHAAFRIMEKFFGSFLSHDESNNIHAGQLKTKKEKEISKAKRIAIKKFIWKFFRPLPIVPAIEKGW